jgi:hypothetical protein
LEVSGIRQGDPGLIERRVSSKRRQTNRSDAMRLPAFIVVVEFGTPIAAVVKK